MAPDRYPSPDELAAGARLLAAAHPRTVRLRRIGSSRAGEPLRLLSVGRGERNVLVVAGPHANEPVGGATALRLARQLAEGAGPGDRTGRNPGTGPGGRTRTPGGARAGRDDPEDAAWHFLLCLDPDGARRNAGWISGPMTPDHHYRHFFRPAFAGQPEWLPEAPGAEPLPETRALLALQDELRPVLQCSLHGVDLGGAFVQLTGELPGLGGYVAESAARSGIPVERGPYDAFHWPSPEPGVYRMPPPEGTDQFASLPSATATSTWFHPVRHGTLTAVVEAPMWGVDAVGDVSRHRGQDAELRRAAQVLREEAELLTGLLERVRPGLPEGPGTLLAPVEEYLGLCPGLADEWEDGVAPDGSGGLPPLNTARVTALRLAGRRLALRSAGLLHRILADAEPSADVVAVRGELSARLERWCAETGTVYGARWIPVRDQVAHQADVVRAAFRLRSGSAGRAPAAAATSGR